MSVSRHWRSERLCTIRDIDQLRSLFFSWAANAIALLVVIAVLDDSNLVHRGGIEGLRDAQGAARDFLAAGGSSRPGGIAAAHAIGDAFVRRRLSPGGAADTLAAACWMSRLAKMTAQR